VAAVTGGAIFSDDQRYRYLLWREWDARRPRCCFVMLNPSTADAAGDDPTTRRCVDFAKRWGFGAVDLVNLFALRATDSRALRQAPAPIGPENDRWIARAHRRSARTVAAWGARGALLGRDERVGRLLAGGARLHRFAQTKGGAPRHPLYLAATERTVRWAAAWRQPTE